MDNEQHDLEEFLEEGGDAGGHADSVNVTSNSELRDNSNGNARMSMTDTNCGMRIAVSVDSNTSTTSLDFVPNGVPVFFEHFPLASWAKLKTGIEQEVMS